MTEIESKPFQSERSGRILGCNGSISWVGTLRCRTPEWHVPYYCWFLNQFLDKTMASKVIRSHWRQQQLHRTLPRTQQQRRFEIHSCSQWWPWGWSKNVGTLLYDSSIVLKDLVLQPPQKMSPSLPGMQWKSGKPMHPATPPERKRPGVRLVHMCHPRIQSR